MKSADQLAIELEQAERKIAELRETLEMRGFFMEAARKALGELAAELGCDEMRLNALLCRIFLDQAAVHQPGRLVQSKR